MAGGGAPFPPYAGVSRIRFSASPARAGLSGAVAAPPRGSYQCKRFARRGKAPAGPARGQPFAPLVLASPLMPAGKKPPLVVAAFDTNRMLSTCAIVRL